MKSKKSRFPAKLIALTLVLLLTATNLPFESFASAGGRTNTVVVNLLLDCGTESITGIPGAEISIRSALLDWNWIDDNSVTDTDGKVEFDISIGKPKFAIILPTEYEGHVTMDKAVWDIYGKPSGKRRRGDEKPIQGNEVTTQYLFGFEKMIVKVYVNAKQYEVSFDTGGGGRSV